MGDVQNLTLDDILMNATELPENRTDYANAVRVTIGASDVVFDFFMLTPNPKSRDGGLIVKHVQRMVIPVSVAKQTGDNLVGIMARWQEMFGVKLPFTEVESDTDTEEEDEK